jgi:hypothetical protein
VLTGRQLRSFLAYAVHGRMPEPLSPSKPRNEPPRDEAYKAWIRTLACLGCARKGCCEAAHTGTDGGMSMKASDYSCVPLCSACHTQAPGAYHRIGKLAFERAHGVCLAAEVRLLNTIFFIAY